MTARLFILSILLGLSWMACNLPASIPPPTEGPMGTLQSELGNLATQTAAAGGGVPLLSPEAPLATATEAPETATPAPTAIITAPEPTSTPDLNALMAEALGNLAEGQMVFNPPTEVRAGERERVELRIMPMQADVAASNVAEMEARARATLEENLRGQGEPRFSRVSVGTFMKAKLTGDEFEITPLNEEEQIVAGDKFTQWAWNIVAVKTGEQELNLTVTVKVIVDGIGERVWDLPVVTQEVIVRVNPGYSIATFVGEYWQWLVTILLLPLLGWGWRLYSTKRDERKNAEKGRPSLFE